MKNDRDMFFLSPKNQDRLIKIMDELKKQGYPTDNRTMTAVLHVMRKEGAIPKADGKEMMNIIKKVVPEGGNILYIKGEHDDTRSHI